MSGAGPWYRAVGWSYLRYSNVCADLLRNVLKEPAKSKAASRQVISYKFAPYTDGKAGKQTVFDLKEGMPKHVAEGGTLVQQ